MKFEIKTKKIEGYEVTTFIEISDYKLIKIKAIDMNLTVDEYIENLIKKDCEKCKNMEK